MEITAKFFEERVGRLPVQDDLERCNCPHAGKMLHFGCGWSEKKNLPRFICGEVIRDGKILEADVYF